MTGPPLTIRTAIDAREREAGIAYVEAFMRGRFGCEPPPTRGVLVLAYQDEEIVGSLALESVLPDHAFTLESCYAFNPARTPFPFDRALIVQGTRWTATKRGVAYPLFRAGLVLAHGFGKRSLLFEAKPYVFERFDAHGIGWHPVPDARLNHAGVRAHVGEAGMKYYLEPPVPVLGMLALDQFLA